MSDVIPETFLKCMSAADRKAYGQMTAAEAQDKFAVTTERKMHDEFSSWLRLNGLYFIHAPMIRKVRELPKGHPDFTILARDVICVEMKVPGKSLEPDQNDRCNELVLAGCSYHVAYNVADAIAFVRKEMGQ